VLFRALGTTGNNRPTASQRPLPRGTVVWFWNHSGTTGTTRPAHPGIHGYSAIFR
jgi:hypothetical protein